MSTDFHTKITVLGLRKIPLIPSGPWGRWEHSFDYSRACDKVGNTKGRVWTIFQTLPWKRQSKLQLQTAIKSWGQSSTTELKPLLVIRLQQRKIIDQHYQLRGEHGTGSKKYCLLAAFDVKKAFNSAKWDIISQALDKLEMPQYPRSYLKNRRFVWVTEINPRNDQVTGGILQRLI